MPAFRCRGGVGYRTTLNRPIAKWSEARLQDGFRFHVPEIADYELRRKLLHLDSRIAITRLDRLKSVIDHLPVSTAATLKAEDGKALPAPSPRRS